MSSVTAYIYNIAKFIVQGLFFILQNGNMKCIEILDTWMLHSCRNKTCIEFCDLLWFAMSNAWRWCKCYQYTWKNPLRGWNCIQTIDMMQSIPQLYYNCTALAKSRPQSRESAMICVCSTLVVFTWLAFLFWMMGATVAAACTHDM